MSSSLGRDYTLVGDADVDFAIPRMSAWNATQAEAARRLGLTQPRRDDLLRGKIGKFSLDTLLTLATRAGLQVKIDVRAAE